MKNVYSRLMLVVIVACSGRLAMPLFAQEKPAAPQAVASVEQLKLDAFKAIRGGQFDRSSDLLSQAASISQDPQIVKMAQWTKQFEAQRETFATERHKQFEKSVSEVHLLLDHHMDSYAIDQAARACLLADSKDDFRKLPWVDALVKESAAAADKYEADELWLRALRMYSDLESLEPANPEWKDKLKLATRRIRLLMIYSPDRLKKLQERESKERKAADELLRPPTTQPVADAKASEFIKVRKADGTEISITNKITTTEYGTITLLGPATAPSTQPTQVMAEETKDEFRVDSREVTKGVKKDMLIDALADAEKQYFRPVSFQNLMQGGLTGIKTIATTKGLEDAFPALADGDKRMKFLNGIDACMEDVKATAIVTSDDVGTWLDKMIALNKDTVNLPQEVLVSEFADGALGELDPFSSMIWPYDAPEFQKTTQGKFGGVGIQIQTDKEGNLEVESPLEDTPAWRAGIKSGDVISQINGKNAHGISLDRAVKTITGDPGTPVVLTVRRPDGTVRDVQIIREVIKVDSVKGYSHKPGGGWDYFVDPDQKIAYIRLTNFSSSSADDMDKAISDVKEQHAKAIVLDLRYNPGGLLTAATEIVNKFVANGVIVSTHADRKTTNPPTEADASPDELKTDLPMVVLVNQYSASASEIVSGALKDHQRALIVGERTFGKGSVQMLFPLDGRKAFLKLTTSHYYLPNGKCIHREENSTTWGVDPDVTIEMTPEQMGTAIDARRDLDVLRDPDAATRPSTGPAKDLLSSDPQLSAALLVLRLKLSGAQL